MSAGPFSGGELCPVLSIFAVNGLNTREALPLGDNITGLHAVKVFIPTNPGRPRIAKAQSWIREPGLPEKPR
jgi:hypothetical protein